MIRLHIVEDHPIIVDGIRQRIRHHADLFSVTGASHSVKEFIASADSGGFDVVILDLWIPDSDPLDNLRNIKRAFPGKRIVIFTQETGSYWVRTMMDNGASAYISKNTGSRQFKEVLEQVYQGRIVAPDIDHKPEPGRPSVPAGRAPYMLKPSERAILVSLAAGSSLKDIARERTSTVSAIEKTMRKIRSEYGAKTNPELVKMLVEQRVI